MNKIAVLSGAGISAESKLKTFRDSGGLWEGHRVEDVATPEAWARNPQLVLDFYNQRRSQLLSVVPNAGHLALSEAKSWAQVNIITQNVDDLHERAGSTTVLHLHGSLLEVKSEKDDNLIYSWTNDLKMGDQCENGNQLRPNIVWFGEAVPLIDRAYQIISQSDYLIVVGTSLQVYPAAGLLGACRNSCHIYFVDPNADQITTRIPKSQLSIIPLNATLGLPLALERIKKLIQ